MNPAILPMNPAKPMNPAIYIINTVAVLLLGSNPLEFFRYKVTRVPYFHELLIMHDIFINSVGLAAVWE